MTDRNHKAFYGDAERTFTLTPELVLELERQTGAGIGVLCQRVFTGMFGAKDMTETIRLAMIGGGENPQRAAELVATYTAVRPLAESQLLAVAILQALWFGKEKTDEKKDDDGQD